MLYMPALTSVGDVAALCSVSPPPFVVQLAVMFVAPYSRSPLPMMFTGGDAKQAVALQKPPQSPSTEQVVRQARPPVSHLYAPHDVVAPALHTPVPLQVDGALA